MRERKRGRNGKEEREGIWRKEGSRERREEYENSLTDYII